MIGQNFSIDYRRSGVDWPKPYRVTFHTNKNERADHRQVFYFDTFEEAAKATRENRSIDFFAITEEFRKFCESRDIIPERLLEAFMADVCKGLGNNGSDERMYAELYLDRLGPVVVRDRDAWWKRLLG